MAQSESLRFSPSLKLFHAQEAFVRAEEVSDALGERPNDGESMIRGQRKGYFGEQTFSARGGQHRYGCSDNAC